MNDDISDIVRERTPGLIALRRHLHSNPETAFQENATAALVAERMDSLGLKTRSGIGRTGVVALLEGDQPGPTLLIRADMDALPVAEQTGLEFASTNGAMHACGHDGHTAMLVTAAEILSTRREALRGNVLFLFQPAEEIISGAKAMIDDGVLEQYKPDRAIGLHIIARLPVGQITTNRGPVFAGGHRFKITVKGTPGHAGAPHLAVDPVVVGSRIVMALQTVVSREIAPMTPAVLTIGRFESSSKAGNIIGAEVVLEGSARAFDPEVLETIMDGIQRIATGIGTSSRADVAVEVLEGYRATINNPDVADWLGGVARSIVGEGAAEVEPGTGGEDMSEFLHRVPGAYFRIGGMKEGAGMNHSPTFDFDEKCLPIGVELFVRAALDYLK